MSDLNSLIDQILSMAREQQAGSTEDRRKKERNPNTSWDDSPAGLEYWKDKRLQNTGIDAAKVAFDSQTKLADQTNAAGMARQGLVNTGGLDIENAKTKGLLDVAKEKETWAKNDPVSAAMERLAGNKGLFDSPEGVETARRFAIMAADPTKPLESTAAPQPFKDPRGMFGRLFNTAIPTTGAGVSSAVAPLPIGKHDNNQDVAPVSMPQPAPAIATPSIARAGLLKPEVTPLPTSDDPGFLSKTIDALRPTNPNPSNPFLLTPDQAKRNKTINDMANTQAANDAAKYNSPEEVEKRRKRLNFNY